MGTRHQINIILDGKTVLSQYGQWDGYLDGQGKTICEFFGDKKLDLEMFKQKLRSYVHLINEDYIDGLWNAVLNRNTHGGVSFPEGDKFNKFFPLCSRDTGADCLELINNANSPMLALKNDNLEYSEYRYDIDLDQMKLIVFTIHVSKFDLKKPFCAISLKKDDNPQYHWTEIRDLINLDEKIDFTKSKTEVIKQLKELNEDDINQYKSDYDESINVEYLVRNLKNYIEFKPKKVASKKKTTKKKKKLKLA